MSLTKTNIELRQDEALKHIDKQEQLYVTKIKSECCEEVENEKNTQK